MTLTMLIAEDDETLRTALKRSFERKGFRVRAVAGVAEANHLLDEHSVDLALLDIRLVDGSGFDIFSRIAEEAYETQVIVMTAFPEVQSAVRAMKAGAADFVIKPFELEELHLVAQRALENRRLRRQVRLFERESRRKDDLPEILGASPAIQAVRDLIRKVAPSDAQILITGETGTGKELVADAAHLLSARSRSPLVKVNCSAVSESLLESELFGHEKGAFTGASDSREGLFEMAHGGTLFLDEISEMKSSVQAKLLRVVEGHSFRRVGGRREIRTNVRILAATNRDLPTRVRSGEFREDLFFRLNTVQIDLPPLRGRQRDVILLAKAFLKRLSKAHGTATFSLDPAVEETLLGYSWPGNVRELRHVMERASILNEGGAVILSDLPSEIRSAGFLARVFRPADGVHATLAEMERLYVRQVVESFDGNLSEAARILGIARNTVKAKL